ncbi:hypothetical protein LSG31_16770 [Fodinisporobacter ferrooxydans]|uniref:CbbX AAA lid domain-containing protein n=1 Tax=Fodinisporobacter ferrooxydans TaxID=2901836 RepID=A0ABY4CGJ0_9BACL|nr:hypothetical protein LSG31_16770 [Alicyclobacillaceae bacterium MYW30-H2]
MEDNKNDFILILAGYGYEMEQFLRINPGMPSRFPITLTFDDYCDTELMEISQLMLRERQYRLSREAEQKLRQHLKTTTQERSRNFSNARMVRNVIERAIRLHAVRLLDAPNPTREDLMTIQEQDLELGEVTA